MSVLSNDGGIAVLDGRLEDAVAIGERLISMGEELGVAFRGKLAGLSISHFPLTLLGRAEEALAGLDDFSDLLTSAGMLRQFQALLLAHAGRVDDAVELSERYVAEGTYGEAEDETRSHTLLIMLETAVLVHDRETSEMLYRGLSVVGDVVLIMGQRCLARILGGAAALLGNHDTARSHYVKALELMGAIRHRPLIALTRLELAELLLDRYPDERAEALEHLDFAINELRDMKMQPALKRALSRREILKA